MPITPSGSPAWSRTADHTQYGGNTAKRNFGGVGVVDATTDVGAEDICRMAADLAAVARTAPMWVMRVSCNDTTLVVTVDYVNSMIGVRSSSYNGASPPTGYPGVVRNATGHFTITFASSYTDEYSVSASFVPKFASGTLNESSSGAVCCDVVGQTVVVRTFAILGAAFTDPTVTLEIS